MLSSVFLAQSAFSSEGSRTLSYLTSWGNSDATNVEKLSKSKVDTFLLSFGKWDGSGIVTSSDNIVDVPAYNAYWLEPSYILWTHTKLANPEKKMLVAFGGQNYEDIWSHIGTTESREKVAQGLVKLLETPFPVYKKGLKPSEMDGDCLQTNWDGKCDMNTYQKAGTVYLDGIDFDYEKAARLTPQENENLLSLAKRIRELLGQKKLSKLISLTTYHVGADPVNCTDASIIEGCSFVEPERSSHYGEVLPLLEKGKDLFDFFNVMTYDAGMRFKYDVAMNNYAQAIGDKSKILLGNTINSQWGPKPEGNFVESRENNLARAAWQAKNDFGGFFVWALGSNNQQMSFGDQVQYINEMHQAAENAKIIEGNQKPVAKVDFKKEIVGPDTVELDGSSSVDPEGQPLSYKWEQIYGPKVVLENIDQAKTRFSLSTTEKDVDLVFSLTVNDGELDSKPFVFTIKHKAENVVIENQKPIANVKYDKEITGAKTVILDGSDSVDPEGEALSYKWVQISGPKVSLDNIDQAKTRFSLSNTEKDEDLVFSLIVNDGKLDSDPFIFTIKHKAEQHHDVQGTWKNDKIYVGGDIVTFKGKQYKAKWWTKNNEPGTNDVWECMDKEVGGEWSTESTYVGGDEVTYLGKAWVAKWWTKGDKPGSSDVWKIK